MRRIIATAALAAILATTAACGGNGEDAPQDRVHPVPREHAYTQVQEGREYVTLWGDITRHDLSDRINALYEMGYEIEHTTRSRYGNFVLIFRKIPRAEESAPPAGTTPSN